MMRSEVLSPIERSDNIQIEAKPTPPPVDFNKKIHSILLDLYIAHPASTYAGQVYSWFAGPPELTQKQKDAKQNARKEINSLVLELSKLDSPVIFSQESMKNFYEKFYEAHSGLVQACIAEDAKSVEENLRLIAYLPLPNLQKAYVLCSDICERKAETKEISYHGLFGSIVRKRNVELIKLFSQNADLLYAKDLLSIPYIFDIAATPELITFNLPSETSTHNLLPYEQMRKLIHLYLEQGFDINYSHDTRNLFTYVYYHSSSMSFNYVLTILEMKIIELVEENKIPLEDFKRFTKNLEEYGILKEFPHFVELTGDTVYTDNNEQAFYEITAFVKSLEYFCEYVKHRIEKSMLATFSAQKNKLLDESLAKLQAIEEECASECMNSDREEMLGKKLKEVVIDLDVTFSLERGYSMNSLPFFSSSNSIPACTSITEWALYRQDNPKVDVLLRVEEPSPASQMKI